MALVVVALLAAMNYANAANSGKFFERLPYLFDFMKNFVPEDPLEIFRAMFDIESPYYDGSLKYDYTSDRHYLAESFYIPNFVYQLIVTVNIAIVSTIIGGTLAFCLCFFAATNLVGAGAVRWVVRRIMEVLRAFPEIVIAGLLTAVLSIGPIAAIAAVSLHTVGALGKLFFEVGAGGIGLKLLEAMGTNSDWDKVAYMVLLILGVVFLFDNVSNTIRSRLIGPAAH